MAVEFVLLAVWEHDHYALALK